MLTEDEKNRICDEEKYRFEVRAAMQTPVSRTTRILATLSSPFVIWILSSVMLALITTGYATHTQDLKERSVRKQLIEKLEIEQLTRLDRMAVKVKPFNEGKAAWNTILGADGAYPEFKERDFLSVVVEYRMLKRDEKGEGMLSYAKEILRTEPMTNIEAAKVIQKSIEGARTLLSEGG